MSILDDIGSAFTDSMTSVAQDPRIESNVACVAIKAVTGLEPKRTVESNGDVTVQFSDADVKVARQKLIEIMEVAKSSSPSGASSKKVPTVHYKFANVFVPAALYVARWYIAGGVAVVGAMCYLSYRQGRKHAR